MRWLKRLPLSGVLAVAVALSLLVGLGLILTLIALSGPLVRGGLNADVWAMIEGVSTALTFAVAVGGGIMVLAQVSEAVEGRNMSAFNDAFDKLMSDENIEARRWIMQELPADPGAGIGGLNPDGRQKVKLVLNSFDHLGFLLQQDWVTSEAVIAWVSPFVFKTWARLGRYVEYERSLRIAEEPDYYEAASYLAERCRAYRKKLLGRDPEFIKRDNAL